MMEIRDCNGHLACMGDTSTGDVEAIYHGQTTRICLPVGTVLSIERQGVVTKVTRTSSSEFTVDSYTLSA